MINIDTETYLIELTRGDNAVIEFTAVDDDGNTYLPEVGDVLVFAVGKRRNKDYIFQIENKFEESGFEPANPTQTEYEAEPTKYFVLTGGAYVRQTEDDAYSASKEYFTSLFWDIKILPEHTAEMKSTSDYYWDLQLESNGQVFTIIGKTDDLDPIFRAWAEVAQ